MKKPYTKIDTGINEDIAEAIHNQIWELHDNIHEQVCMSEFRSEDERSNIRDFNDKIFQKNAKKLKKQISKLIDYETTKYSNMTRHFSFFKCSGRPRSEKNFNEIEEDKRQQRYLSILVVALTVSLWVHIILDVALELLKFG